MNDKSYKGYNKNLDDAIMHCNDVIQANETNCKCKADHIQLKLWLEELKMLRQRKTWEDFKLDKWYDRIFNKENIDFLNLYYDLSDITLADACFDGDYWSVNMLEYDFDNCVPNLGRFTVWKINEKPDAKWCWEIFDDFFDDDVGEVTSNEIGRGEFDRAEEALEDFKIYITERIKIKLKRRVK